MGSRRLDTLLDLSVAGFNLLVTCNFCARWRVIDSGRLMFARRRVNQSIRLHDVERCFRCAGCGRRDVRVRLDSRPATEEQPARQGGLRVVESNPPPGVAADAWARASPRERQRLANRARG